MTPQGLLSPQTGPEPGQAVPEKSRGLPSKDAVGCASFKEPNISGFPDPKAWRRFTSSRTQGSMTPEQQHYADLHLGVPACSLLRPTLQRRLRVSDLRVDSQKQTHPSSGSSETVFQLGANGKVVSYIKFLYSANTLVTLKTDSPGPASPHSASSELGDNVGMPWSTTPTSWMTLGGPVASTSAAIMFICYISTMTGYVKPSNLKKDMNETFPEKSLHIELTLSKIRTLKPEMPHLSRKCGLES